MAGLLFKMDGTQEVVEFPSRDIAGCKASYKKFAATSIDPDLVDVRAVEQGDGSIEYVSCIYDSGASTLVSEVNKNFLSEVSLKGQVLMT